MLYPISTTTIFLIATLALLAPIHSAHARSCGEQGVALQVLGSGGPELTDQRASSGYLVWQDGKARVLLDMGTGSLLTFEHSGARIEDLDAILLSHLHVDHSADLPGLVKASFFNDRARDLPLFGPTGNRLMPDTETFAKDLFGERQGAFRYLGDYLNGEASYRLQPRSLSAHGNEQQQAMEADGLRLTAVPVHHGPIPALAWRVDVGDKVLVFSGDMNGEKHTLEKLAEDADLLVAHNAVPEDAKGPARNLHMPPSVIGRIAAQAKVKQLVLSHRMQRTLGVESDTESNIRKHYRGPLAFADDGDCFTP